MAKIVRENQKVFGDNAAVNNFFQFGDSSVTTKDVGAMQNGNWENGWSSGGVNINGVITPQFQEFNTLSYVTTSQIAYLQQEGIAEYHAETEYHQNSIVKESGTTNLYVSLTNNNTGNAVNSGGDNAFWKFAGDLVSLVSGQVPVGTINAFASQTLPANYLECDGSTLSTSQFNNLFNVIGYTYGGSGTSFNVPDLRGEFIRGWDNGRGIDSGRAFGSSQTDEFKSHRHFSVFLTDNTNVFDSLTGTQSIGRDSSNGVDDGNLEYNLLGSNNEADVGGTSFSGGVETRPRNVALKYIIRF